MDTPIYNNPEWTAETAAKSAALLLLGGAYRSSDEGERPLAFTKGNWYFQLEEHSRDPFQAVFPHGTAHLDEGCHSFRPDFPVGFKFPFEYEQYHETRLVEAKVIVADVLTPEFRTEAPNTLADLIRELGKLEVDSVLWVRQRTYGRQTTPGGYRHTAYILEERLTGR